DEGSQRTKRRRPTERFSKAAPATRRDEGSQRTKRRRPTERFCKASQRTKRRRPTEAFQQGRPLSDRQPIRRALVSVYDKDGLDQLARALHQAGVAVVSTGSTAAALAAHGLAVTPVEAVTGTPELLGDRVKTLHPTIHASLLTDRRRPDHLA